MEQKHRDAIRNCFTSLVNRTDLDLMVSALYEKGVFSDAMIEPYRDTAKDQRMRRRQLYRDITRRGPHAFQHLLDALSENGYWDIVRELDPNSALNPIPRPPPRASQVNPEGFLSIADKKRNTGKEQDDPNKNRGEQRLLESSGESSKAQGQNGNAEPGGAEGTTDHNDDTQQFIVVKSTRFFEDHGNDIKLYRTRGRKRGLLVLFSYIQFKYDIDEYRAGAAVDTRNLRKLFYDIGFNVICYNNLTLKETQEVLEKLQSAPGVLEGPETVFVVFSSHGYARSGSGDTDIRCSDGNLISYYSIIEYFNNDKCPALVGIPKVFIFQACRGSNKDYINAPRHMHTPAAERGRARHGGGGGGGGAAGGPRTAHDGHPYRDDEDDDAGGDAGSCKAGDRLYSDILIAHSTLPGYVSNRDRVHGSWYIQALCSVFAARAHDCHVEKLFTLVDESLRTRFATQTSSIDRWGFNRRLYLHPGLYED